MDGDIDDVVAGNRKAVYPVVESKGEIAYIAVYEGSVKGKLYCI